MRILRKSPAGMAGAALAMGLASATLPAAAQTNRALQQFGGFLSVGGYAFTDSSGRAALGDLKFGGSTSFYTRPRHFGAFNLAGGLLIVSASDHFLPFSGGNEFQLIGPAFRVDTPRVLGRVRPYLTGGLFAGRIRSERLGFDRTNFTPSVSVGAEYPFARYFTLYADYRVSQRIHDVSTDGVSFGIRVF